MAKRSIKIQGKLTDTNKQPIAKLRTEAWDKDMLIDDFVGEAISDEQGSFTISFTENRYKELFLDRNPDIYFKIYDGDALIHSTENSVLWNIKNETVVAEILVDMKKANPPADKDHSFRVKGHVRNTDSSAFVGGLVYAYDKDLRTETLLGKAVTNETGYYEITYSLDKFGKTNNGNADLQLRVFEKVKDGDDKLLVQSEIFFNASQVQEINLILPVTTTTKEKSEWEKINGQVLPLLKGQRKIEEKKVTKYEDLPPFELTGTDIDFIVSETNLDRVAINAWVASNKIFNDVVQKLDSEHPGEQAIINEYGWPFFYAIARQGIANNLATVLQQTAENLKRAISAAIFANRIPAIEDSNIEQLIKAMDLIQRLQLLDPKQTIGSPFARVLASVAIPVSRKLALDALAIVQEKGISNPDAVLELVKQHPDEEHAVNLLVRSLRVNNLVSGHVELFQNLNARLEGDAPSIAPLATIPISGWVDIAAKTSVSHGVVMEVQVNLEKQHPLTALGTKLYDGSITLADELSNEIKTFIKQDETKAEAILKGQTKIKDDEATPGAEKFLKNTGRFVRTGLNMELAGLLMNMGVDTPAIAIRYSGDFIKDQIREKLPFLESDETIDNFIGTADKHVKAGFEIITGGASMQRVPIGFYGVDDPIPPGVRENLPGLPGLFGDMDECICKPCESMLGQPAYLVDLLNLLNKVTLKRKTENQKKVLTALSLLNERRSDITGELKLGCEHTENIQHIDIVIEILEKAAGEDPYQQTALAIYPWQQPFDLARAEIKAYFAKLNISRSDLLRLKSNDTTNGKLLLAAEILDIAFPQRSSSNNFNSEWQLLTVKRSGAGLWNAYGFNDGNDHVNLVDPSSSEKLINLPIQDVLLRISVLLDRTGLDLDDFEEMIATSFIGPLSISNRSQCKTSLMRLDIAPHTFDDCLDRIHRFVRLHRKLSDWSFKELDLLITTCNFTETSSTTSSDRENLLSKLATVKRLSNEFDLPIEYLVKVPQSMPQLYNLMGITVRQLTLLKAITGLDIPSLPVDSTTSSTTFNWEAFEKFCTAAKRITENKLTIEQVADTLLTRDQLKNFNCPFNEAYRSDESITEFLEKLREHISSVVIADLNINLKTQVSDQLTAIFGDNDAAIIVNAISDAGAEIPIIPTTTIKNQVKNLLLNKPAGKNVLGYSFPLLPGSLVEELLAVKTADNPSAEFRFSQFILSRLREKALIARMSELCSLSEIKIIVLLKERLLLDDTPTQQNTIAFNLFLDQNFLNKTAAQHGETLKSLIAWIDRLFRLKALKTSLGLENELLELTERIVVNNLKGINWRETLASIDGTTGNRWPNKNWQAIEDVVWLQQPDNLSRKALLELFTNLEKIGIGAITPGALQPVALRLTVLAEQVLAFRQEIIDSGANAQWLDVTQLRKAFTQMRFSRIVNVCLVPGRLTDIEDNIIVAGLTKGMVELIFAENDRLAIQQTIDDILRPQKRNALVALLIQKAQPVTADDLSGNYIRNANDLYEHYLIDPLMEPCMITSRILEAITATQLFAQRILFGLEPGIANCDQLKQQWTWMRNYRVWEANRKVFLFPENWLYPELRDDKSSSFKQLESALGQGELNADLADEVFGQYLDDVAQMGQVDVLGMYEDISMNDDGSIDMVDELPKRRILYVIGRSPNPPYIYYWRKCIDFGNQFMEWSPWQRIELDIQGDHVMPFIKSNRLFLAWPQIQKTSSSTENEKWKVDLVWSYFDGANWRKVSQYRHDPVKTNLDINVVAFTDQRSAFCFRSFENVNRSEVEVSIFAKQQTPDTATHIDPELQMVASEIKTPSGFYYKSGTSSIANLIKQNITLLGEQYRNMLAVYRTRKYVVTNKIVSPFYTALDIFGDPTAVPRAITSIKTNPTEQGWRDAYSEEDTLDEFVTDFQSSFNNADYNTFARTVLSFCSRRILSYRVWIRVSYNGDSGLVLLNQPTKLELNIGTRVVSLAPGEQDSQLIFGESPEASCSLRWPIFNLDATEIRTSSLVPKGSEGIQTLHFEINAPGFNPSDFGVSIPLNQSFNYIGSWVFCRNGRVIYDDTRVNALNQQVDNSEFLINGYWEKDQPFVLEGGLPDNDSPLSVVARNGRQEVFSKSIAKSRFFVVGATLSSPGGQVPNTWYYKENDARCFIDLFSMNEYKSSELKFYPSSWLQGESLSQDWFSLQKLPNGISQAFSYGFEQLPAISQYIPQPIPEDFKTGEKPFDNRLPMACYSWEIFFHGPVMVADQLSKQHKFEDAERWLRYIFDPTSAEPGDDAKRFLNFRVFKEMDLDNRVINDLKALAQAASGLATDADVKAVQKLIQRWREFPFRPFVIARGRQIAFLWYTLFAYLDNLLAWADSLYRQDTRESINEAVMIYVLAQKILGRRPQVHEGKSKKDAVSYNQLAGKWDDFANYWIDIGGRGNDRIYRGGSLSTEKHASSEGMLYFCMPFNDKMLNYWNSVDDRLFNIRHCRNIEGIERTLPLTEAPIDPGLLVRAVNNGLNLADVINGLYAPPPQYRYSILAARAADLCNETKALGAAMLSAIEKKDAEHLSLLRSTNEISLLKLVSEVKTLQITEAERNIDALSASRKSAGTRYSQYQRLLGKKDIKVPVENESAGEESMLGNVDGTASQNSALGLIKEENEVYMGIKAANDWSTAANITKLAGSIFHFGAAVAVAVPDPLEKAAKALTATGQGISLVGDGFSMVSQAWRSYADQQSMLAGHLRRRDEWAFQSNQTLKEIQQIDKQILANKIRIDIARKELSNHLEQMEQAQAVDEVMRSKFSNEQLYQWMITQLSGLYFNAYRMTLEMARSAERAAARELGAKPLNILRNDYWDSLHMGLLAGDRLHQDLKRLEIAYLDQNRREYEMTKHISLRRLDAKALIILRSKDVHNNYQCNFDIPEWLFDLDTPGHYLRRIKSVSVSIPCIVGPYTSVNCKLTLLSSRIRYDKTIQPKYDHPATGDDPRFTDYFGASEAIVTSNANTDSGLFETQLRDERFLPFEGSGVISTWRLELPGGFEQFDYSSISDVILTIRYTARDGGDQLRAAATSSISDNIKLTDPVKRLVFPIMFSCRSDFSNQWASRLMPATNFLVPIIKKDLIPYWMDAAKLDIIKIESVAVIAGEPISWGELKLAGKVKKDDIDYADLGAVTGAEKDVIVLITIGKK